VIDKSKSKHRIWFTRIRTVAAWLVIPAFLSMYIANEQLNNTYPGGPWPSWVERPKGLELMLMWRNYSLIIMLVASLISIPRWQSIVGIVGLALFLLLFGPQ
jgi:hypothetical protein